MYKRSVFLLRVPPDNTNNEEAAENLFAQLAEILKGQNITISAEMGVYNKFLWFFLTCPDFVKDLVKGQWYSQYGGAEAEEVKDYTHRLFFEDLKHRFKSAELYLDKPELVPIQTYDALEKNPLASLAGVASSFEKGEYGFIQLVLKPAKKENLWNKFLKSRRKARRKKVVRQDNENNKIIDLQNAKEESSYFETTIRFITLGKNKQRLGINLSAMTAVYKKSLERPNQQKLKEGKLRADENLLKEYAHRVLGKHKFRLTPKEIATFFHLPYSDEGISQVVQVRAKKAPPPQNLPTSSNTTDTDLTIFGETNYQNAKIRFGLKTSDRRRHLYIIGKTGMGKSKLIELLIQSDLKNGKGIILLDPHGDLAQETLSMIPQKRMDDVVYFNPSDTEYPIGFNPMGGVGGFEFRQNIVAGFISIFKKLFGLNWNERFEHVLRYTSLALLEYPQASILGIPRMLTDNMFRQDVIGYVTDPLVKKFWTTEFATWNEQFSSEAIVPIINKFGQFTVNPMIRNIVGQAKTGFPLDEIMNQEKIFIANLSMGQLGEDNSALLGAMLVTKIWEAAMRRASIPESGRKDTFMYADEFQNFATSAFANILSEARKYRLNLTVAHQYMQQLPEEVRATIFGNVSNIISFRVGGEDAKILVNEFEPVFATNDFLNLDIRDCFIKMSIDGQTTQPFSARTITIVKPPEEKISKIIELSRKKWARKKLEVEKEIQAWETGEIKRKIKEEKQPEEEFFPEPIV